MDVPDPSDAMSATQPLTEPHQGRRQATRQAARLVAQLAAHVAELEAEAEALRGQLRQAGVEVQAVSDRLADAEADKARARAAALAEVEAVRASLDAETRSLREAGASLEARMEAQIGRLRQENADLLSSREFVSRVLAASTDAILVLDQAGTVAFLNEGGRAAMEVDDAREVVGRAWAGLWDGEARLQAEAAMEDAWAGGTGRFQASATALRGGQRFWDVQVTAIPDAEGRPEQLLAIARDTTQQRVMMEELSHRVKNSLTLVQALATQTLRGAASLEDGLQAFSARIGAMAGAHDILLTSRHAQAALGPLVAGSLRAYEAPGRFEVEGPEMVVGPKAALALALLLHELSTNAAKYGALSLPDGSVRIDWREDHARDPETGPQLVFRWQERGGPPVAPPARKGFGTKLIERGLAGSFGGRVELDFRPEGLVCRLTAPMDQLQAGTRPMATEANRPAA